MPDVRLRQAGLPGDVLLVPGERPLVDVRLITGTQPDVMVGRQSLAAIAPFVRRPRQSAVVV
jgi:hypothetical protein